MAPKGVILDEIERVLCMYKNTAKTSDWTCIFAESTAFLI